MGKIIEKSLEISFQDLKQELPQDLQMLKGTELGNMLEQAGYQFGRPLTCTIEPKNMQYIFEWETN